jgi:amino acid adenylation domain-containing protein
MAISMQSLADLSLAEKRILLAQLLQEKADDKSISFPLSHAQRGLWFLHNLDRESHAYNVSYASRIRSRLDLGAFRRALKTLVERHSSLRTTFEERAGVLLQSVGAPEPLPLELIDASSWSGVELRAAVQAAAHRRFDLEAGPLLRMSLFTCAPDDHVFLVGVHHIVGDFWSLVLLVEEMQALYPAECSGKRAALPLPAKKYRDFVDWQSALLSGPEGERLWAYWQRQLSGAPTVLELPGDRTRPRVLSSRGGAAPWRIDRDLALSLRALAAAEGVTLYTVLLAAFGVLLWRYTGAEDFLVGAPCAGRSHPDFEAVVGCFINMLPLRANLAGDPTFRVLLLRIGAALLDAIEHQDYPFDLIVERLGIERDPSRAPLVQTSFTLERAHRSRALSSWRFFTPPSGARLDVGGLQVEQYDLQDRSSQLDLEMVCEEGDGTVAGLLRYNSDLFEPETANRMVGHFLELLQSAARTPDCRLSALPWLTEAERRLVLHEWNQTRVDFPKGLCLHHLFEQQEAQTPEANALLADARQLTYAELNSWSNRLAHRLHRMGVGPGALVALCLERSPEMIAAILGTLKAGAAYVPLEPDWPEERLRLVLSDTGASVLLAEPSLVDRLSKTEARVLNPHSAPEEQAGEEGARPPASGVRSDDLAYVIYTSGSTGHPKGVMIEHRAICNTILWRHQDLTIYPDDRVLFNLPYTFDPSLGIIFPTLAAGARIILAQPGEEYDPHKLLGRVLRERVTIVEAPPFVLRMMLDDPLFESCRTLRWLCCGGEAMPPDLPTRLFQILDVDLYNLYGPTEGAVDTTWWSCRRFERRPTVPIGRPIANVQVYVLDANLRPVPPGVPGELYIGGAGLARGYKGQDGLTAACFIPNPFSDDPGARLYRSGDRCRWLADGTLEFLGRLDHQVKVRCYRIELGEVEAALAGHPTVREAAVVAQGDSSGASRLVAYVVASAAGEPATTQALRSYLKERLPDYMVPARFVLLPALPRTPGGKVDRRALPLPPNERPELPRPFVAPRTPMEDLLAELWREALHLNRVGTLDNFFELGGNSIQAAVVINRLQERLGHPIDVIALFDSPTIADLAQHLAETYPETVRHIFGPGPLPEDGTDPEGPQLVMASSPHRPKPAKLLVPLQPEGAHAPWFMVHPPGGIVVCYQALAHRLGRERPFYGIRSRGLHGDEALPGRMEEMAAEYVAAVREIQSRGPYHLGGWSVGGLVALEMAQQLLAHGERISVLALLDTTPPAGSDCPPEADRPGREYGLELSLEELARLGPNEQLPYLWQHALRLGLVEPGVPLQVVQQVLDDLKRLFHHHLELANAYTVKHYRGRISLFRPCDAPVAVSVLRDRGWGKLAADVDVHFVPGQHHSMVKEPHVSVLARMLKASLEKLERACDEGAAQLV